MIVLLIHLTSLFTATSAYNYLTEADQSSSPDATISYISMRKYTARIEGIPHHVLIVYNNFFCSGSLVRSKIVLTAASCFEKWNPSMPVLVKLGSPHVSNVVGQVIEVLDIKTHEYFGHSSNRNNDVAILILREHVQFGRDVKKIMMIESDTALRTGISLDVSGWGSSNLKAVYINSLLWSEMVVIDRTECKKIYKHLITSSNFCVRYQPERRLSDNGGPAQYAGLLVGVLSFGAAKTDEPFVAVLTNVSYFNRWINLNSERLMKKYCKLVSTTMKDDNIR